MKYSNHGARCVHLVFFEISIKLYLYFKQHILYILLLDGNSRYHHINMRNHIFGHIEFSAFLLKFRFAICSAIAIFTAGMRSDLKIQDIVCNAS